MRLAAAVALLALGIYFAPMPARVEGDRRVLRSASGYQTVSMLDGGRTGLYYDVGERVGELRPEAKRVVLLGLGGGEMLRAARRTLPMAELIGVEISERNAWAARAVFHVDDFGVKVVVDDAARFVDKVEAGSVDAYLVDIYDDATMPLYFRSPVFFRACRRGLSGRGLLIVNVWPPELEAETTSALVAAEFSSVRRQGWRGGNVELIADR